MAKKTLKVKKNHDGVFKFTVHFIGIGSNVQDAWSDVVENIGMHGLGSIPSRREIKLIEQEPQVTLGECHG